MRATIIPSDKWVRKDDVSAFLEEWPFDDSTIHAIQWHETYGEIEYRERPPRNESIQDPSILEPYLLALEEHIKNKQLSDNEGVQIGNI